jgi:CRP-like cAMP-binding protein
VAILGPHEIFGEMSLLTGEPRSATVRAKSSLEVLEIGKSGLQKILAKRPDLSDKLAQLLTQRQSALASPPNKGADDVGKKVENPIPLAKTISNFLGSRRKSL